VVNYVTDSVTRGELLELLCLLYRTVNSAMYGNSSSNDQCYSPSKHSGRHNTAAAAAAAPAAAAAAAAAAVDVDAVDLTADDDVYANYDEFGYCSANTMHSVADSGSYSIGGAEVDLTQDDLPAPGSQSEAMHSNSSNGNTAAAAAAAMVIDLCDVPDADADSENYHQQQQQQQYYSEHNAYNEQQQQQQQQYESSHNAYNEQQQQQQYDYDSDDVAFPADYQHNNNGHNSNNGYVHNADTSDSDSDSEYGNHAAAHDDANDDIDDIGTAATTARAGLQRLAADLQAAAADIDCAGVTFGSNGRSVMDRLTAEQAAVVHAPVSSQHCTTNCSY
jgi:hypothetical protein